jgi:ABC-2 type transport system permease protein
MAHLLRVLPVLFEMNVKEFYRDPVAAFFSFFFPLLFLLVFGVSEAVRRPATLQFGIVGSNGNRGTDRFVELLSAYEWVTTERVTLEEGNERLRDGRLAALVVVHASQPADAVPTVSLVVDTRRASVARMAVDSVRGQLAHEESGMPFPVDYKVEQPAGNPISDFTFIFPGLVAMALLQLGLFATATPLLRSRDRGTLRHLSTTPVSRAGLMVSQVLLRFTIATFQLALLIGLGTWLFHVHMAGSWVAFGLSTLLGTVMLIAMGYALAGSAPSLESGMVIVMLINFGMLFFGQVFFDFSGVSFLRPFVRAVPLSYLSDLLRQIMSGIEGLSPIWIDVLALVGWTIAGVTIATWRFQFDMEER